MAFLFVPSVMSSSVFKVSHNRELSFCMKTINVCLFASSRLLKLCLCFINLPSDCPAKCLNPPPLQWGNNVPFSLPFAPLVLCAWTASVHSPPMQAITTLSSIMCTCLEEADVSTMLGHIQVAMKQRQSCLSKFINSS